MEDNRRLFCRLRSKTSQITRVDVPYVTVEWDNISHKDAKTAPVGHITLKINHKIISSRVVAKGTRSQEIYSLKDVIPQGLECRPSTTSIAYGEKEIKVYLTGGYLYFPGITKNGQRIPVLRYEWKIPKGWKLKSGQQPTPSGTYIVNSSVVELITNEDGGGDVCVRGLGGGSYDACVDSDIYSSYSNKLTFTRSGSLVFVNYPSNIRLGEVKTYEFSVRMDGVSSFDWSVPPGWKINGKTGTYRGGNSVQITTGKCPTQEKVKVKKSSGTSWKEFPINTLLPSIQISGEMIQYKTVNLSLNNISNNDIGSVEWFVNGSSIGKVNNGSAINYQMVFKGGVKVSAILTLIGCSPISIPSIGVDIKEGLSPSISGPTVVCNQGTYTVQNLPIGASIRWSAINNNLQLVSGQNSKMAVFSKRSNGKSAIRAEITIGGRTINAEKTDIWVGEPDIWGIDGYESLPAPGAEFYKAQVQGHTSCIWECNDKTYCEITPFKSSAVFNFTRSGVYIISATGVNDCGRSKTVSYTVKVDNRHTFSLYPNPATDAVTLRLTKPDVGGLSLQGQSTLATKGVTSTYEIQLWSGLTMLKSFKTNQPTFQIPIAGLPAGLYFVRVIKDGQTYTEKLIKN